MATSSFSRPGAAGPPAKKTAGPAPAKKAAPGAPAKKGTPGAAGPSRPVVGQQAGQPNRPGVAAGHTAAKKAAKKAAPAPSGPAKKGAPAQAVQRPVQGRQKVTETIEAEAEVVETYEGQESESAEDTNEVQEIIDETAGAGEEYQPGEEYEYAAEATLAEVSREAKLSLVQVPAGTIAGELDQGDYTFPMLQLAQFVGNLTEELGFSPGDIVFDRTHILWQEGYEGVELTICSAVKQWQEVTAFGEDMGQRFDRLEEAIAYGLSADWGPNGEKPGVLPQMIALVLIKAPSWLDDYTGWEEFPDGNFYMVGMWRIAGSAYKSTVRSITGAGNTRLRGENGPALHTGSFILTAQKIKGEQNTFFKPVLQPGNMHGPELVEEIERRIAAMQQS